jgi:DNA-directed RNA polymerase specialized sigma24 family protein
LTSPVGPVPADVLLAERSRLYEIALRLLGSRVNADRTVDHTLARWREAPAPGAMAGDARRDSLTEILALTCVEAHRRSRFEREHYLGDRLPEPVPDVPPGPSPAAAVTADPADRVKLVESLNMLLPVVLESLTPEARVAIILHDVFGVPYTGISKVVGRSSQVTRELARSARRQIQQRREQEVPCQRHRDVVLDLLVGCERKNETKVRATLHPDITVIIDGGEKESVSPSPVRGVEQAARLLIRVFLRVPVVTATEQSVNGQVDLVFRQGSRVVGVLSASIKGGRILDIWLVLNPDKLRHWNHD